MPPLATMNAANRKPTRDPRLIEGVLVNLPLMEGVARQVVRQLSTQSVLMIVKRGEIVIRRGERVRGVYAIAYGSVKKRMRHRGGAEVALALLGPGDSFAEVPALLGCPAKVEAVALAESMLVIINAECISAQTVSEPRLARNLNASLVRRMQALLSEFERGMMPGPQRLAGYLDTIAEATQEPGHWVARLPVSKTLLAARLDMTKETLSRLLRRLAADGLIDISRRDIVILDRSALTALSAA
jgi:CRP/FNR family transcriptional regulator, dissimilatory nitrate respiration regulator